jgi:hypothetical protein
MADNILFTNNASALLAATITAVDTTVQVASGFGALFPSPSGGKFFYATLEDDSGNIEIVQCTSRTGDNLTVVRAADGTTAQAFTLNVTRVELRAVKIVLDEFLQKNGGTLTGNLDFNGNNAVDAVLTGANTQILAGEIVNVPIRNAAGVSANEIAVPVSPGRATVGGAAILATGDDIVAELDAGGIITLDSATVGVKIPAGAYLRIQDSDDNSWLNVSHDGTDFNFVFENTTEVNWDTKLKMAADLQMTDNFIIRPVFDDYAILHQVLTISGNAATLNYSSGQSAIMDLQAASGAVTLTLTNPPATGSYGEFSLKIIQGSTARTVTWPGSFKWPDGTAPTLTTTDDAVDVVSGFTIDGGTTWYVTFAQDFS